jgi:hypothetical protein
VGDGGFSSAGGGEEAAGQLVASSVINDVNHKLRQLDDEDYRGSGTEQDQVEVDEAFHGVLHYLCPYRRTQHHPVAV